MKIIFVDVDGVLCLDGSDIDKVCLEILKDIVVKTGAKIVVSSTWRLYQNHMTHFLEELEKERIEKPIGVTDDLPSGSRRHQEISKWLSEHPEVTKYAILDDYSDACIPADPDSFFQTDTWIGLTPDIGNCIVEYLGK